MMRLDEDGPSALVQTAEPVNRFPDFVAYIVRRLKVVCPAMGTARIAAALSRAGLHVGRTTVRRMLKRRPRRVAPAATVRAERRIRSSRPNHIWLVDLTTVPTLAGFWISWLPWSVPQRWPFCCWVAVGIDHFSRRIMGIRVFRSRPKAVAVSAFLTRMIRAAGQAPRHLITDRGREFTARSFRSGCRRAGIRQRFGAIGKHGSIALVERCIRTLKDEGVRRSLAPIRWRSVGRELSLFADWHNGHRPHGGLAGATPDEVYFGRLPAHHRPRYEPRPRWPRCALCSAAGAGPRAAGRAARARGPVPGRTSAPSPRLPDPRGVRPAIRSPVPAAVAVCARAAQHAARRAIPVAVLTLCLISPRRVSVATAFATAKTASRRDPRSVAAFTGPIRRMTPGEGGPEQGKP